VPTRGLRAGGGSVVVALAVAAETRISMLTCMMTLLGQASSTRLLPLRVSALDVCGHAHFHNFCGPLRPSTMSRRPSQRTGAAVELEAAPPALLLPGPASRAPAAQPGGPLAVAFCSGLDLLRLVWSPMRQCAHQRRSCRQPRLSSIAASAKAA